MTKSRDHALAGTVCCSQHDEDQAQAQIPRQGRIALTKATVTVFALELVPQGVKEQQFQLTVSVSAQRTIDQVKVVWASPPYKNRFPC